MSEADLIEIAGAGLSAAISPLGAELQWLRDGAGRDLLWDGDPTWWTGRAPVLFPVIGALNEGVIRVDGTPYPMPKHGFARRRTWTLVARTTDTATFRLSADAETRDCYPFEFQLDLAFMVGGAGLELTATLTNPADTALPASFGFHPALRWPLPYGRPRAAHRVRFADPEPAPIRRINADGLLRPDAEPTPVAGHELAPDDTLFAEDALIFDQLRSRTLVYGAPGGSGIEIGFPAMPQLGVWTKPGAPFLCIEPWAGIADPAGYRGEFADKPGIVHVPPRGTQIFAMSLRPTGPLA